MSNQPINDGGPAFPHTTQWDGITPAINYHGMTLRQYAAIRLRVPDSGTDWLDDMIRKSNRDYFAAAAINEVGWYNNINQSAIMAYEIADAMLKARGEAK
jgi:G:T-mismatch repair DNA endonuclease (very short patch repair protein)